MAEPTSSRATHASRDPQREKPQLIADALRNLIMAGELDEGDSVGRESELIEQFGVSRPTLREALRILEAEGLITVVRGALGGVIAHHPSRRHAARTAALLLQTRNVTLADVSDARAIIEPAAVRLAAKARNHRSAARHLRTFIAAQGAVIDDPVAFGEATARFHEELVGLAGNQTLSMVAEMLDEVVARAVTVSPSRDGSESEATRLRGIRSEERLAALIEAGNAEAAEQHWRDHMTIVAKVMLGEQATTVVELLDHLAIE